MLKVITTLGPVGGTAMPGTWASFITALILFCITRGIVVPLVFQIVCAFLVTLGALWILWALDQKTDDSAIVIDEVAGMVWALVGTTAPIGYITAFLLFRFFDITKFAGVGLWERLPRFWGIVADDLWAAVVTILIIHGIPLLNHFAHR
jgi:phosphatidylglycerophosphatase A